MEFEFLSLATLIEVTSVQENRIRSLRHDLIFLVGESGHTSIAGVLLSAPGSVHIDLLKVSVDVVYVNNGQVINILLVLGWEAVNFPDK